jgi:hypothetical protein
MPRRITAPEVESLIRRVAEKNPLVAAAVDEFEPELVRSVLRLSPLERVARMEGILSTLRRLKPVQV